MRLLSSLLRRGLFGLPPEAPLGMTEFVRRGRYAEALARKKRAAQLTRAARYVELIAPRVVIPSAGPPCFLDDELFRWNDIHDAPDSIFPDQRIMVQRLEDEGHHAVLMLPGSVGAFDAEGMFRVEHLSGVSSVQDVFADKETYLRRYAADWAARITAEKQAWVGPRTDLFSEIKAWFEPLMALSPRVCSGIGAAVRIQTDDTSLLLDFPERAVVPDDGLWLRLQPEAGAGGKDQGSVLRLRLDRRRPGRSFCLGPQWNARAVAGGGLLQAS